ncbi:MAG TPA: serine/threonine-protein kinase [Kofleriaceae bacterium]|nr:serine/threonine-protein kinase [Kofleriaceae bacterium]
MLGAGGMGEVYLAKHIALGMKRAVKVLRTDLRARQESRDRFSREAQVLARLQHNSIVQLIEFGALDNGWPFLAMEYIEGPGLDELVAFEALPMASALVVLEQLAVALQYAHSLGVIHRDLKPSNILVRSGDLRQVKVIDFGLARLVDTDTLKKLTADGQPLGSPAYMAPEQVDGGEVSAAADVYALGGIAYMLLSGKPPFERKTSIQLMAAHKSDEPPRISSRCAEISEFLDSLFYACLAKDPAQRPASDELASHLSRITRGTELPRRPSAPAPLQLDDGPRVEVVASPWATRSVPTEILETAPPDGAGAALANQIIAMIGEIANYLSTSDPELTSLLRLEASIREQLSDVERDSAAVNLQLEQSSAMTVARLTQQQRELIERRRTLHAQQKPLQKRMIEVVETHRRYADGPVKFLFEQIDRALEHLDDMRSKS